jgi:uncharacterized membrane-anchored protein
MNKKQIFLALFIIVALAQLYIPARMILDREEVLDSGREYKFRTAPLDPVDPFRGKYITLRYEENMIRVKTDEDWVRGETIYVLLETDRDGYARVGSVSKEIPSSGQDFLKAKVNFVEDSNPKKVMIKYPFDRYYMEESKASEAERVYRQTQLDTSQVMYALVSIKDGESVLKDVIIGSVSIKEYVKNKEGNHE